MAVGAAERCPGSQRRDDRGSVSYLTHNADKRGAHPWERSGRPGRESGGRFSFMGLTVKEKIERLYHSEEAALILAHMEKLQEAAA